MKQEQARRVLILGIGNILLQDEGLGVRAVERLQERYELPPEVQAIDGGVMGLDLLPYLEGVSHLLVVDAVQMGAEPGTLVRLEGDEIPRALPMKMSLHQVGLQELLFFAQLQETLPPHVVLWGMEPASFDPGLDLSPTIASRLDDLVEAVYKELLSWGIRLQERSTLSPSG